MLSIIWLLRIYIPHIEMYGYLYLSIISVHSLNDNSLTTVQETMYNDTVFH